MARVRAALRRYARLGGLDETLQATAGSGIYQTGGLILDDGRNGSRLTVRMWR